MNLNFHAKDKKAIIDEIENILLILCFVLTVIIKFYKLPEIPYGLHLDEGGMAYDAWCLANYGIDRWLNKYPVYLINFQGGQSSLCAYFCALLIKIAGGTLNPWLIRMPSAILSTVAYIAGLYLIRKVFNKHWTVIAAFLLGVLPYFVMQGRWGLDCNLLVNMLTISLCLLLVALEKQKLYHYVIAGISWGLTYYTYALSYVPNTIILVIICGYLLLLDRKLWKKLFALLIPVVLLGFPLLLMIVVNHFGLEEIECSFFTIPVLPYYRGTEIELSLEKAIDNISIIVKSLFFRDQLEYNAFSGYYTMYTISIPFIIIGFFSLYRYSIHLLEKKIFNISQVFLLIYMVYFVYFLTVSEPNVNKANGFFFSQFFLLIWGIRVVYQCLTKIWKPMGSIVIAIVMLLYISNTGSFLQYYFTKYPKDIYPQYLFYGTYENILAHLEEEGKLKDNTVYIDSSYIHYCLSTMIDPYVFDTPGHNEYIYENFVFFFLPPEYNEDAVYIIREGNYEYIDFLEHHVTEQYRDGMYVCYY